MVSEKDAIEIISRMEAMGIEVLIDGGWGVDALLGVATRPHNDIDLFVEERDGAKAVSLLTEMEFAEVRMDYTTPTHTAWRDAGGRIVDLHIFTYLPDGQMLFQGESYPSQVFDATGVIGGKDVRCITPEYQVMFHCGYEHDENDGKDVRLLCEKFNLPVPDEYQS